MVKKTHLVTGKGGVGKSLFSAVLAHYLSQQNQQVLLTELNEHSFYRDFLNVPEINYNPSFWRPNVDIAQWSPEDCLKEYALHLLKIESLYNLFINNVVTKSLIQIAPGLHELALLGKLTSSPRRHGPPMSYDQVVVDSFSTGHFLSLLRAPSALYEAIPLGPMGEQSKAIDQLIRNPEFTEVHLVCLPEELPVSESIELYHQLKNEFGITAKFYLNKMSSLVTSDLEGLLEESKELLSHILNLEKNARKKIEQNNIHFVELPLVSTLDVSIIIKSLTHELENLK